MEVFLNKYIIAIITTRHDKVSAGSVPTFYCDDEEERERIATSLSKITSGMVHDMENGVYVIVRH
jgi:hypothetical protein